MTHTPKLISSPTFDARTFLEEKYGKVYDEAELNMEFDIKEILVPFVRVVEKSTGIQGTLVSTRIPKFFFDFIPE